MREFESIVLREIFGLKGGEVTEGCRKLYKAEFCDLCS
jgi:hypothetical protein